MERSPAAHERQAARYRRHLERTKRRISVIAVFRLVSFLLAAAFAFAAWSDRLPWVYGPPAAMAGAVFLVAVTLHRRPYALAPRLEALAALHADAAARVRGEWAALSADGARFLDPAAPELGELQVFGRCSLFQLVNRATLPAARARLAAALRRGVGFETLAARQTAAAELAPLTGFRHRLEAEGRLLAIDEPALARFLTWAEAPPGSPWLGRLAWLGALLVPTTWTLIALTAGFDIPTPWTLTVLLQLLLFLSTTTWLSRGYAPVLGDERIRPFVALRRMFELVERRRLRAPLLQTVAAGLTHRPSVGMARLESITEALAVRYNAILAFLVNTLGLWELFWAARLERWRRRYGPRVRADLDTLADFEVLCSIAGFAHDRPGYAWPDVGPPSEAGAQAPFFDAEAIGHPLIPLADRRCNDFSLAAGRLALITGSNMSGKSSFLRTLGVSARLALAGAPVCARRLRLTACELSTSIQVTDAPEQGMSRFYAEVKRIRRVLDEVTAAESEAARLPRLYLVDEMLSGTNSRERHLASHAVVGRLLAAGRSCGLVTTHDLALAALADAHPDAVETWHFSDRFDGVALHFDYRLRAGVATTTNALDVLRMEGIEVPADDG